jgi:glycosyltransferase involved in cell wall biosynthesis
VEVTGRVSQAELKAYYHFSHIFISMSEHEGFGVPLIEAMHFGLPVLAYKAAAGPETMGGVGVLFCEKRFAEIAEFIELIRTDEALRNRLIAGQRERAKSFLPERVEPQLRALIEGW